MKKIISLAVMLLMIITMLTGCMNTVPTVSENGAVAFINVKVGVEQISLAVDKSEKVIVTAYGKYNDKNEYVSTDKKDTLFKDIDVAGKELNKALEDITALKLLSSSTEFFFDVSSHGAGVFGVTVVPPTPESDALKGGIGGFRCKHIG
jgi:predicted small secreted protein